MNNKYVMGNLLNPRLELHSLSITAFKTGAYMVRVIQDENVLFQEKLLVE